MEPSHELMARVTTILSPIIFLICIYVILVNSLVIWGYFRVESKTRVTFLFVAVAIADISIAANIGLRSIFSWFCLFGQELPTIITAVFLSGGMCSYNLSNFYHVTLSVLKCINIKFPFYPVNFNRVKQILIVATVLWVCFSAGDLALYLSLQDNNVFTGSCNAQWTLFHHYEVVGNGVALYLAHNHGVSVTRNTLVHIVAVQYVAPCIIIAVSMAIQINSIRSSMMGLETISHVTGTVIIISALYLGSNGTYAVFTLLEVDLSSHHVMRTTELVLKFILPLVNCAL